MSNPIRLLSVIFFLDLGIKRKEQHCKQMAFGTHLFFAVHTMKSTLFQKFDWIILHMKIRMLHDVPQNILGLFEDVGKPHWRLKGWVGICGVAFWRIFPTVQVSEMMRICLRKVHHCSSARTSKVQNTHGRKHGASTKCFTSTQDQC